MAIDLSKPRFSAPLGAAALVGRVDDYHPPIPARLVVAAPHPDDEILGLGGFLARCARSGSLIEIVAVTDGEGAYVTADVNERGELAETRARERRAALQAIGAATSTVHRLALADGAVAREEVSLGNRLVEVLGLGAGSTHSDQSTVLVTPWRHDLHPDHEATARAALTAATTFGCELWEVPIWSWYHAGDLEEPLPLRRAARIPLSSAERIAKRVALGSFQSQTHPPARHGDVVPDDFFSAFDRDFEIILR
jgi:LmbE family N-acetylglucosaminyl deacetylase